MTAPLRVLLAEDSPTDAKLVLRALRDTGRAVESERVEDAAAMRAALARAPWDLVLSDWSMPEFSALGALAVLKESGLDLPFIIVSGTIGEELAVEAMRAGAHDYVLKDRLARLAPAVERELRECALRAERAREQARFQALIEHSADGVTLTSADGVTLYRSPAVWRILGFPEGSAVGDRGFERLHPDDRAKAEAAYAELTASPSESRTLEVRVACADGSWRWVEVRTKNLLADPVVNAFVSNLRDITERRRSEAALRAGEARFRQLAESIREVFWMTDLEKGVMVYVSPAYESVWGRSCESLYASPQDWSDALHPEDRARVLEAATTRQAVGTYDEEYRIVRPDGTVRWIHDKAFPVRDEGGRVVRVAGVAEDVTARRELEGQFRQSQKMEAVGRLAGGIAHDFNNLLSVVLGYADLALGDLPPGERLRDDLIEIKRAGERAAGLTQQLLAFSRQQVMAPRVLDLAEVVAGTERMLRRLVGEDVELALLSTPGAGRCKVDPGQVEQVVMNLVVNARDAMPLGGRLTIETCAVVFDEGYTREHLDVAPGAYVMLSVSDTGCGMDAATRSRIFEPFFTTKEKGKGTGLGLSTVFGIVKQSGGHVWVYSEPGVGTTFKVYFPQVQEASEAAAPRATQAEVLGGSETILLVEDEEQVRAFTLVVLRRAGYHVLDAANGSEGLLVGEQHGGRIDLLLTDVVLPRMSGRQLAERLCPTRPEMRVIYMSGYTEDAVLKQGVLHAGVPFLQKPLTPTALLRKVREVLG